MEKRLYRSRREKMIGGVCAGIAQYFDIDPTIVRLLAVALLLAGGTAIVAYIIAWIVVPEEPENSKSVIEASEEKPRSQNRREVLGWILVIIGVLLVARYLMPISLIWFPWGGKLFLGVIILIAGILFLARS
ncbi:PspC domain-containing protein [Thermatribacter velox]|uniref:PspC domain-containing protein n=1 Tax=Thermatribacter velox TaxID=3039681 RepID=A0ABZ2YEJ5_9BACT